MSKFIKKREQSKKNLMKLKTHLNKLEKVDIPSQEPSPSILSFICKLFRLRN